MVTSPTYAALVDRVPPMHPDQLTLAHDRVRALVDEQFPAWAQLPLTAVPAEGTVNAIFRIGERLAARFPVRPGDRDTITQQLRAEAEAAGEFAAHTRFPAPEPVALPRSRLPAAVGGADLGRRHDRHPPTTIPVGRRAFARDLAALVAGVRAIDTRGRTFSGTGRGGDLRGHDAWVETCFARSVHLLDVPGCARCGAACAACRGSRRTR
jgi:aminoglycoside phosphotransferase (APT) family kinase protein